MARRTARHWVLTATGRPRAVLVAVVLRIAHRSTRRCKDIVDERDFGTEYSTVCSCAHTRGRGGRRAPIAAKGSNATADSYSGGRGDARGWDLTPFEIRRPEHAVLDRCVPILSLRPSSSCGESEREDEMGWGGPSLASSPHLPLPH
ncbi:hypothetical protein B296_00027260, partial [Ensete ventricosum]